MPHSDGRARVLKGKRVLVTRPRAQAEALVRLVEREGATAIVMPAIKIVPADIEPLIRAFAEIESYDWIIFTSVNGVAAAAPYLKRIPDAVRIAAIGPSTAKAVEDAYRKPDVIPAEFISDAISPALGDVEGKRILLARADIARRDLAIDLQSRGAKISEVATYRIENPGPVGFIENADFITVTSSSAVRGTIENLNAAGREDWIATIPWVCIGPVTAKTATELGCFVCAVAERYTIEGLLDALIMCASKEAAHA